VRKNRICAPLDTDALGNQMSHADAAAGDGAGAVGQFVADVPGPEHGAGLVIPASASQSFFDSALASGALLVCSGVHSKRLRAYEGVGTSYPSSYTQTRAFRVFLLQLHRISMDITLV
jgi:hypothetical protein